MTELLPADWSNNKELYSLRYEAKETDKQLLLKAVVVSSTMIFNLMVSTFAKDIGNVKSTNLLLFINILMRVCLESLAEDAIRMVFDSHLR